MTFRPRRGNYVREHRGRYYYRRAIPQKVRHLFAEKTEWVIPLEGRSDTERSTEAQAIAHRHNRQIEFADAPMLEELPRTDEAGSSPSNPAEAVMYDLYPQGLPPGAATPTPLSVYRDGQRHEVYKVAITELPQVRRRLEGEGYFVMSIAEMEEQAELAALWNGLPTAKDETARELSELKIEKRETVIDALAHVSGHTVTSILDDWRRQEKQAHTTWKKHVQYVNEFAKLHGDLALQDVTKRHVVEYVAYAQGLTYQGKPLSPASVRKRLDSVRALLGYAVSADIIDANPATGVRPPKDTRPKTSRSYASFEPAEVRKLVDVASELWSKRRDKRPGRARDLTTALQVLVWSGARPEEIAQARRSDVDLARGVIRITNDESDDDARPRLTKNEHSIREVPIHPRLTPVLTQHLRSHNGPLLFPSFEPEATPAELEEAERTGVLEVKGRYARPISREWTDNLRERITDDPRKVLYSLRHSWSAESRRTGMPEHVRNAIMGHADDNPHAGRYGGDADWTEEKRKHVERMNCLHD
ncbi:Site-specific recombinase XerD [Palleronia marisminoris]|uniref:Tyrosine recombinase XerC n=1 Tax=Palleronia marisminoris TaxID=315423 RepID=A0A1Y5SDX5_9RHOB|nr:tyrosine-type recombinase/integrase [Palleronia marisminoris]SFG69123.1 Site-specific recombinase XerD [Palleronia marisminoris]SLN35434.1 Tyrosine recombinase XerC [Palleronia marisminoris]